MCSRPLRLVLLAPFAGLSTALLLLAFCVPRVSAQACRDHTDLGAAEACLEEVVHDLRIEIEAALTEYVELLSGDEARDAQFGQDTWERYLEDECRDAGDRFRGGPLILVEILSCQEWGARQRAFQLQLLNAALRGGSYIYDPTCFVPASDLVTLTGWVAEHRNEQLLSTVVINLEQPLCTDIGDGPQVVNAVQLVGVSPGLGRRARRMYGARVHVEGRLYLPHLPFHRTPLVLVVQRMDPG